MTPPEGTELIAELPQGDLDAAVSQLVPLHFVRGEDACTPNQIRVHQCPRERAAALLWELPPGTTPFDLHAQARELSRHARTIVWDSWPSLTLVEHMGGEETSKLDSGHDGGELRIRAMLDARYGLARTPVLLATYHHSYEIATESEALSPLLRAVIERAVRDGRAEVGGLGAFVCHPGPPRSIGYLFRREPVDLDDWSEAITPAACTVAADALRSVIDRLVPATNLVVPGLACFGCTEIPDYHGTNPRTGERVFVAGKRVLGVMLEPPP